MKVACKKCNKEYEFNPKFFPIINGKILSEYCRKCTVEIKKHNEHLKEVKESEKVKRFILRQNNISKNNALKKLSMCKKEEKRIKRMQVAKLRNLVKNAKDRISKKIKKKKHLRIKKNKLTHKKLKCEITPQDKLRIVTYKNFGYNLDKIGEKTRINTKTCRVILSENTRTQKYRKYLFDQIDHRRKFLDGFPADYFKALSFNNKTKMYDAICEECGHKYQATMQEIIFKKKAFFKYGGGNFLCSECKKNSKLYGNRDIIYIIAYKSGLSFNKFIKVSMNKRNHIKGKLSKWSRLVRNRDKKCMYCGSIENLHAHHIKHKIDYPELAFDICNGITLCSDCHYKVHYG